MPIPIDIDMIRIGIYSDLKIDMIFNDLFRNAETSALDLCAVFYIALKDE